MFTGKTGLVKDKEVKITQNINELDLAITKSLEREIEELRLKAVRIINNQIDRRFQTEEDLELAKFILSKL